MKISLNIKRMFLKITKATIHKLQFVLSSSIDIEESE